MLISEAYAQTGGFGGDGLTQFLPLILIFVVFYFLLIRPQQKKMKAHREMISNVRRGDRVVTGGGIIGQVVKVISDNEVALEIADGVRVRLVKGTITDVLARGEPVRGARKDDKANDLEDDEDDGEDETPALPPPAAEVKRPGGLAGFFGPKK